MLVHHCTLRTHTYTHTHTLAHAHKRSYRHVRAHHAHKWRAWLDAALPPPSLPTAVQVVEQMVQSPSEHMRLEHEVATCSKLQHINVVHMLGHAQQVRLGRGRSCCCSSNCWWSSVVAVQVLEQFSGVNTT